MAIVHNLSSNADNLSGFDPVSGESEGTTIGRSWLMWKIFEGFTAQFTNFVKITNSSPTPTFLQGDVGSNLQTEPTKSRTTNTDTIRFYDTNQVGLTLGTPQAFVWEWKVGYTGATGANAIQLTLMYHKSGGTLQNLWSSVLGSSSSTSAASSIYCPSFASTTTAMANIPALIFWRSSNLYIMCAISKLTGFCVGYHAFLSDSMDWSGYKHNVGAITQDGTNFECAMAWHGEGMGWEEIVSGSYEYSNSILPTSYSDWLVSIGREPTGLFTFDSINNVIGGKLRMGLTNPTAWKTISAELEGVLSVSSTAVAGTNGTIATYNSKYYLLLPTFSDGRLTRRIIAELGA